MPCSFCIPEIDAVDEAPKEYEIDVEFAEESFLGLFVVEDRDRIFRGDGAAIVFCKLQWLSRRD
jgi:hypothetical protein